MPLNQKDLLDDMNWRILEMLQKTGRASFAEIGRAVGLSAPAVKERVQKMEDEGLIQGYQVVLDPEKLGFPIRTIVQLQVNRNLFPAAIKALQAKPEVIDCYRTTGTSSLLMVTAFTSMHHMEEFLNEMLHFGEPVSSIVLSHPVSQHIYRQRDTRRPD